MVRTSERLRQAWVQPARTAPIKLIGASPVDKEELILEIVARVYAQIRVPEDGYSPVKGKDYFDGIDGRNGKDGAPGKDGKDGRTPSKEELLSLIEPLIPYVRDGKDGSTPGKDDLLALITPIVTEAVTAALSSTPSDESDQTLADKISGVAEPILRRLMTEQRKGWFGGGGGGDQVRAGTGVTITTNAIGAKVISVAASDGTNVYGEEVSGSGTSWTLGNTPTSGTLRLFANGQRLKLTTDYSITGTSITTVLSWDAGSLLADYAH